MATGQGARQETDQDVEAPETALHALDLAISVGAATLISAAILLSRGDEELLPRDLFVAALAIGRGDLAKSGLQSSEPTSFSSAVSRDRPAASADSWLYDWLVERTGRKLSIGS
jgi:hypothetical protein